MKKVLKVLFMSLFVLGMSACQNRTVDNVKPSETNVESETNVTVETTEESKETIVKEVHEVLSPMEIQNIGAYRDTNKSTYIEIQFSKEIQDNFDASSYVKVEPDVTFTVSKVENKLLLRGEFNPAKTYDITVLSGIRAIDGTVSTEEKTETVAFDQKLPKLMFTNEGIIL